MVSWNGEYRDILLFDKEIVQAVLDGDRAKAERIAKEKCPKAYLGGSGQLQVEWVTKGARIEVDEYDGHESLTVVERQGLRHCLAPPPALRRGTQGDENEREDPRAD
ncbi:hypothetical protein [Delftia sp.]|uniref:hypothetical protein n=1 Tax=Delftia sp. TaxID=1886637 RepID=UPI00259C73DA|nr:hypothetical protein [Delftia sp.]